MSYVPDSWRLDGLSVRYGEMMGKPCINAFYANKDVHSHRLIKGSPCCICGRQATEVHHSPPLGMGNRSGRLLIAGNEGMKFVQPALFAVCRECHDGIHGHRYELDWNWESDEYARSWWEDYPDLMMAELHGHWTVNGRRLIERSV